MSEPAELAEKTTWRWGMLLFLATLLLYLPTVFFGFLNWDDPAYVFQNDAVTEPGGLTTIWSTIEMPKNSTNWPLVFTTFWVEHRISGGRPWLFHFTNAFLHALAAVLAYWMLLELGAGRRAALLASALFAIHPVQIESVAWISERKNVLSGVFFFASVACYFRYRRLGSTLRYLLAMFWFSMALLSKSSVVALPLLWILADRLVFDRKWSLAAVARSAVPLAMSATSSLLALSADVVASRTLPVEHRPFAMATTIWFYLGKLINPSELIPVYPRWQIDPSEPVWWISLGSAILLSVVIVAFHKRIDAISLWGVGFFLLMWLPISGIKPFGYMIYTFVADHFIYLPCLGVFLVIGRALALLDQPKFQRVSRLVRFGVVAAVASLCFKTLSHLPVWKDDGAFWDYTLETSPAAAHDVLATGAFRKDDYLNAAVHLREVVHHRPGDVYALSSLGQCLFRAGDRAEGLQYLRRAVELAPDDFDSLFNLGKAYASLGDFELAEDYLQRVLKTHPSHAPSRAELGFVYLRLGDLVQARTEFEWLLNRFPNLPLARLGMAETLVAQGRLEDSERELHRLTVEAPKFAEGWRQYATLHWRRGRSRRAIDILDEGVAKAEEPSSLQWLRAEILADDETELRNPEEALRIVEQLTQDGLAPLSASQLAVAAQVHAANKRWQDAVAFAKRAVDQAHERQKREFHDRLAVYRRRLEAELRNADAP